MLCGRASRSLPSIFVTSVASAGGQSGRADAIAGGSRSSTDAMMSSRFGASNGGRPAIIS